MATPSRRDSSPEPLTEDELARLTQLLAICGSDDGMNLEELDGFLVALIAGPELVPESEYLPAILGGNVRELTRNLDPHDVVELTELILSHCNTISKALLSGQIYFPIMFVDEDGVTPANDWADGFMKGVLMRQDLWAELFANEGEVGCLVPVLMLHHEHDDDPELRGDPISEDKRDDLVLEAVAGAVKARRYFKSRTSRKSA